MAPLGKPFGLQFGASLVQMALRKAPGGDHRACQWTQALWSERLRGLRAGLAASAVEAPV